MSIWTSVNYVLKLSCDIQVWYKHKRASSSLVYFLLMKGAKQISSLCQGEIVINKKLPIAAMGGKIFNILKGN